MRVLVVDDSDLLAERLAEILSRVGGVELLGRANDAAQARDAIRQLQPDVVILDLCMPGESGMGILRDSRRGPIKPIVIVLTSYGEAQYRKKSLEMGAAYFLDKTTQLQDIPRILQELVAAGAAADVTRNAGAERGIESSPASPLLEHARGKAPSPAGTKSAPTPQLRVSRWHKGEPIYYVCSHCLQGFPLADDQPPPQAAKELYAAFQAHVEQEHPDFSEGPFTS